MLAFSNSLILLFSGLTLAIAFSFLLITLWQDARKPLNQFFAVFLLAVMVWNVGSLFAQVSTFLVVPASTTSIALGIIDIGFTASALAIYSLTAALAGVQIRRFRLLTFLALGVVVAYQIFLLTRGAPGRVDVTQADALSYQPNFVSALFYLAFDAATFLLAWRYRRKIRARGLVAGILIFVFGQSLGLLNPELRVVSLSINISSFAALIISFAILRKEIITPLAERITQIETMHRVSLAITSQIAINTVLNQIAVQAVRWLDADASAIFLRRADALELATVYNLPRQFVGLRLARSEGIASQVADSHQSVHVENYRRDWQHKPDMPLAKETFGSVICVPLEYGGTVIGVLMVIAGQQGRLFNREDVYLLELLGGQAAVAIAHSQLFAEQSALTHEVEMARSQLETVLVSTENPVIAADRDMRLIFSNPAANTVFSMGDDARGKQIQEILPASALPPDARHALRQLRQARTHVYEIKIDGRVYLCHLACLGGPRIDGWVAVLNDVTQLKELDRLKSEMVRMTSHDLKNPLQAAMANLELLRDDLTHDGRHEVVTSINAIEEQLDRMERIINGTLDLERIRSGTLRMDLCKTEDIVQSAVDELRHMAQTKALNLNANVAPNTPDLWGDQEQIKRTLVNLIENAVKFTPPDGQVHIAVQGQGDDVLFTVSDTGIGIPPALHAQIFDRFFRGRQPGTEHISGSGLGLSLVKAIVDNHGGKVWLESEAGAGTTFYVLLPAASARTSTDNLSAIAGLRNTE